MAAVEVDLTFFDHHYSQFSWNFNTSYEDFISKILPIIKAHPKDISIGVIKVSAT